MFSYLTLIPILEDMIRVNKLFFMLRVIALIVDT